MLREDGILTPVSLFLALIAASIGAAVEALLMRGLLDVGRQLGPVEQRAGGVIVLFTLLVAMLALELPTTSGMMRMGRRLETRLRVAFLSKSRASAIATSTPSRPRTWPTAATQSIRSAAPVDGGAPRAQRDGHARHVGRARVDRSEELARGPHGNRDLGRPPVRRAARDGGVGPAGALVRRVAHALLPRRAPRALRGADARRGAVGRAEHAGMLMDWMRAAYNRLRVSVVVNAFEAVVGFALAVWLTFDYLHRTPEPAAVLLLLYWALNIPQLGQESRRARASTRRSGT